MQAFCRLIPRIAEYSKIISRQIKERENVPLISVSHDDFMTLGNNMQFTNLRLSKKKQNRLIDRLFYAQRAKVKH